MPSKMDILYIVYMLRLSMSVL